MRTYITPVRYWHRRDGLPDLVLTLVTSPAEGLICLPTQFVLLPRQDHHLVFDTARFWSSRELGLTHTKTVDSESWAPHFLLEHWENCGDDGHLVFELVGYAVLSDAQLHEYWAAARAATNRYDFPQIEQPPRGEP